MQNCPMRKRPAGLVCFLASDTSCNNKAQIWEENFTLTLCEPYICIFCSPCLHSQTTLSLSLRSSSNQAKLQNTTTPDDSARVAQSMKVGLISVGNSQGVEQIVQVAVDGARKKESLKGVAAWCLIGTQSGS